MLNRLNNSSYILRDDTWVGVTSGTMNFPVRRQMAGNVQYTSNGMDVQGYTTELM